MLTTKDYALLNSTKRYFRNNKDAWRYMAKIIKRPTKDKKKGHIPSLRLIFFFVSIYTRYNPIIYKSKHMNNFNIFDNYKQMLNIHTKQSFDPFCRRSKELIKLHNITINTNVGQLTFFKWFFENNVHKYIMDNYSKIIIYRKNFNKQKVLKNDKKVYIAFSNSNAVQLTIKI